MSDHTRKTRGALLKIKRHLASSDHKSGLAEVRSDSKSSGSAMDLSSPQSMAVSESKFAPHKVPEVFASGYREAAKENSDDETEMDTESSSTDKSSNDDQDVVMESAVGSKVGVLPTIVDANSASAVISSQPSETLSAKKIGDTYVPSAQMKRLMQLYKEGKFDHSKLYSADGSLGIVSAFEAMKK